MNRRKMMKSLGLGTAAGFIGFLGQRNEALAQTAAKATKGLGPLKITKVRPILTSPQGQRLVVVKVETSEPGFYGLGCATFNQRALAVKTAVEEYLDPFARGRDADNINEAPGWGVEINEELARKFPLPNDPGHWRPVRRGDGTSVRP